MAPGPYFDPYAVYRAFEDARSRNGLGVASLACGVAGFFFLPVLAALAGVITGHLGLSACRRGRANNRGMALAGTIVSYVSLAFGIAFMIWLFVWDYSYHSTHLY
ncbi:MAG: DUF4190 domain-containing protein [Micrococcales bacterium]|nr:DUF4190 domain-containing protein [Micrococcales bacterium]